MKIVHTQMNHPHLTTTQSHKAQAVTETAKKPTSQPVNEAELASIKGVQKALAEMPEVDLDKVAQAKAAIRDGSLNVDPDSLAQSMQKYYRG